MRNEDRARVLGRGLAAKSGAAVLMALLLLVASLLLAWRNERIAQQDFEQQIAVRAEILAGSVSAALAFDDSATAQEFIDALRVDPEIDAAAAYDITGKLVAGFATSMPDLPATIGETMPERATGRYELMVPVEQNGTRLGTVYLRAFSDPWSRRLTRYVGIGTILLMATLLIAVLSSSYSAATRANRKLSAEMDARREAEEALRQSQKMEAMGQLTGGVAHDFNNLLMVASSGLDLLERIEDPARRQRIHEGIRQAIDRGTKLTQQLLTFARRSPVNPEVIDIAERIRGLDDLLNRSLREDVTVKIDMPADLWPVEVDISQFEVALLNIAVNARDAMPEGGTIHISARNVLASGAGPDRIRLAIRDEGQGMSADTIDKAFEPFFTTKDVGRGTGLGLSQVYGFARSSGGRVDIESETGKGTSVIITLPRSYKEPPIWAEEIQAQEQPGHLDKEILLVEDDPQVAELVSSMLDELGYTLCHVTDAAQALARIEAGHKPDLLLSDMVMPGTMNGLDLAQAVRERWPGTAVLLMTGYSDAALAVAEQDIELLRKPYRMKDLQHRLAALLH